MMGIDTTAIVSCYADTAGLLITVLLVLLSKRFRGRRNLSLNIFYLLVLTMAATCVLSFICHATLRQPAPWCHFLAIGARTIWEILAFVIILLWAAYVENKLYGGKRPPNGVIMFYLMPFGSVVLLLFINLFSGIVFSYSLENQCETKALYNVIVLAEAVLFMVPMIRVRAYDQNATKVRFLHVLPMVIPVALGVSVQFFLPYQADVLGFAIGALLLYFSMSDEIRFQDEESGLYNVKLLAHIVDPALAGKHEVRSALILEAEGHLPSCFQILRDTLFQSNDVIRVEEKKFLMFSSTDSRSALQLLATHVEEAVAKHNTEHPDEIVRMKVHSRVRTVDQDAFTFLRSVIEDKDAGDPVRGVVSMISELDRLDEELKLAADIQLSMLPMNFPAFPGRNEFDLFASMRPAKEVGGDFYDFFLIDEDHLGLVIADVSGKGIPAALFMMISKTLLKNQLMSGCDPATALERVNDQLYARNSSMMFVTVWLAVLEISTGKGIAANAGHENPALRRSGKDFEMLKYKHGMVVGVRKSAQYENREFELSPGDTIFVYTDGVPEATNDDMKLFGEERLLKTLNRDADAAPTELCRRMLKAVDDYAGDAPQFDDITMLSIKYCGPQNQEEKPE